MYNSAMEMANGGALSLRKVRKSDLVGLGRLTEKAIYRHYHSDWFSPTDWLESPLFVVAEEASDRKRVLIGCFAVTNEVPSAAWVRLAVLRYREKSEVLLKGLINNLLPHLYSEGVQEIGWLVSDGLPDDLIRLAGFSIANWIITLQAAVRKHEQSYRYDYEIREVRAADLAALSEIERSAFEPIWQLNTSILERAYKEANIFKVALAGDRLVGFQFCSPTNDGQVIHLVRITVDPEHQRCGVGSELMSDLIASCVKKSIKKITLNTQINNLASHHLYNKFGFERIGLETPLYIRRLGQEQLLWNEED